jgi:hypothetical protein
MASAAATTDLGVCAADEKRRPLVDTSQLRQATEDLGVTVRLHPATAGGGARVRAGDLQPFHDSSDANLIDSPPWRAA